MTQIAPEVQRIVFIVCEEMGVSVENIFSKTRKREIAMARQIAMYIAKEETMYSLKAIGRFFQRHHSTVIHAIDTVLDLAFTNKKYNDKLNRVRGICQAKLTEPNAQVLGKDQENNLETFNELKNQL